MAAFMDEVVIDPISGEQVTAKHAILVPQVKGITEIVEYLKSVASIVGPKNIRSAYKVGNNIKIYLRFLKHVEEVISGGVHLRGQYTKVDYSVPPATEMLLTDVEAEIPNSALISKLENYGRIMSKIITLKVAVEDADFSHIESNTRRVFVHLLPHITMPSTLTVSHCMKDYAIGVDVVSRSPEKSDPAEVESPYRNGSFSKSPSKRPHQDSNELEEETSEISLKIENRPKVHRGRGFSGRGRGGAARRSIEPIKVASKMKHIISKRGRGSRSGSRFSTPQVKREALRTPTKEEVIHQNSILNDFEIDEAEAKQANGNVSTPNVNEISDGAIQETKAHDSTPESVMDSTADFDEDQMAGLTPYPFSMPQLKQFLREVKNHRNPMEVALNMLEANNTTGAVSALSGQLSDYYNCCKSSCLRMRITRLVQILDSDTKTTVT